MRPKASFFSPEWAWPPQRRDSLLKAVLLPDQTAALAALKDWLLHYDLDEMTFADHRLLAAITERHGRNLSEIPEYPRLKGLQRQLWTQSRIRLNAALPMLKLLHEAGIELMLLKGAARITANANAQRQRSQQDVDILVRDEQIELAARILSDGNWQTARGDSAFAAIARASTTRAINFQLLPWGDIDLHRRAYHGRQGHTDLDQNIWNDSVPACFFGLPVRIPSLEERLAMTLSHGAHTPEAHSDWLLDAAELFRNGSLNWTKASEIFTRRRMVVQAQIGLSYLQHVLGDSFPVQGSHALASLRPERGLAALGTKLLARPENEIVPWLRPVRKAWLGYTRGQPTIASGSSIAPIKLGIARRYKGKHAASHLLGTEAEFSLAGMPNAQPIAPGRMPVFTVELIIPHPGVHRRVELELNSERQNLARFRLLILNNGNGFLRAKFKARISNPMDLDRLVLESRPGKLLIPNEPDINSPKYKQMPFQVLNWSVT